MYFPIYRGLLQRVVGHVKAVDGVSFSLSASARCWGWWAKAAAARPPWAARSCACTIPTAGEIWYPPARTANGWTLLAFSQKEMKPLRREMRMIFQDPFSSLNPRLTVKDIIGEPLEIHGVAHGQGS